MAQSTEKILIPRLFGGLGNQLFIYSAARRLALINNAELVLDNISGFKYDKVYNRKYQLNHFKIKFRKATSLERLEPLSRERRFFLRYWNSLKPLSERNYIQEKNNDFEQHLLDLKLKNTTYLEGYWQSEKYFKDIENTIRDDLHIIAPTDPQNKSFAKKISNQNSIAIHVRFFDSPETSSINKAAMFYYKRSVEKIESLFDDAHYFIFSDKPEQASSLLKGIHNKMTVVSHNLGENNTYADFWLMSLCNHFIIANSTFSWWASWLKNCSKKIILKPTFEKKNNIFLGS